MNKVDIYLALGSNLGDRRENLRSALSELIGSVKVLAESPIYETLPVGYAHQPNFLNMTLKAQTDLTPERLLKLLKEIETKIGRIPTFRNGPRIIDMDILFYNGRILKTPKLTIPHPRLHERAFVLVPLADIAPDLSHPLLGKTVTELLAMTDSMGVRRYE